MLFPRSSVRPSIPSGHRMVLDQPLSSVVKIGFLICTFYVLEYDTLSIGFLLWVLLTLLDIPLCHHLANLPNTQLCSHSSSPVFYIVSFNSFRLLIYVAISLYK